MSSKPRNRAASISPTLRQRAEALLHHTRQDIAVMPVHDIQRLVYELQLHQIELEMQNDELRRAQRDLAAVRNRYADLYDFAPIGYLSLDANGVILEANLTATQALGVPRAQVPGQRLSAFVAPDPEAQDTLHLHRQQVFAEETPCTCSLWMQRQDDTPFYAQLKSLARREGETGPLQWRLALIDLTAQRQQAEADLRRLALQQQQRQEQERAHIAREIHDTWAQNLTSLHMDLAWLAEQVTALPAACECLHTMAAQVEGLDQVVHRLAMALHPRLLDDLGLPAAIDWQLEETCQRTGAGFSRGRAGIATKMRYAFGILRQGFQRRPIPDAMPQRQHTLH